MCKLRVDGLGKGLGLGMKIVRRMCELRLDGLGLGKGLGFEKEKG